MIPISKPMIGEEEIEAVVKVLKTGIIAQGPKVREFEEKFAKWCGSRYGIAVNSGTAALHCALYAQGIGKDDEVITSPFTFIASANSIRMQQAIPQFVDIEEDSYTMDPDLLEKAITKKTKAIMTVDLYGQLCDYDKIEKFAKEHGLAIIEDAAQAHGASLHGKKAGTFGSSAAFSLYATKNMACGEGGILTTSDEEIMEKAKVFRQHGRSKMSNYEYVDLGYNYRMMDLQAAIALEQLKKIDMINTKRNENAKKLTEGLRKLKGIVTPKIVRGTHVFHQYTVRITSEFSKTRDEVMEELSKKGVNSGVYYPKPLHFTSVYKSRGFKPGDFPVAEKASAEVLSLPVHPMLTEENISTIIEAIASLQ